LAVLRWRGASARTITRFQRARGVAVRWGAARMQATAKLMEFILTVIKCPAARGRGGA